MLYNAHDHSFTQHTVHPREKQRCTSFACSTKQALPNKPRNRRTRGSPRDASFASKTWPYLSSPHFSPLWTPSFSPDLCSPRPPPHCRRKAINKRVFVGICDCCSLGIRVLTRPRTKANVAQRQNCFGAERAQVDHAQPQGNAGEEANSLPLRCMVHDTARYLSSRVRNFVSTSYCYRSEIPLPGRLCRLVGTRPPYGDSVNGWKLRLPRFCRRMTQIRGKPSLTCLLGRSYLVRNAAGTIRNA